jgi:ribosomal-protein-alanine N-acetyltransferase
VIASERLYLQKLSSKDFENTRKLNSDPEVMKYIRQVESYEETKKKFQETLEFNARHEYLGYFSCFLKETNEFVGRLVLRYLDQTEHIEIGYTFLKEHWGKGYATEMGKVLLTYGFETIKPPKIVAVADPQNIGSHKVLEKLGLTFKKEAYFYNANLYYFEAVNPNTACL